MAFASLQATLRGKRRWFRGLEASGLGLASFIAAISDSGRRQGGADGSRSDPPSLRLAGRGPELLLCGIAFENRIQPPDKPSEQPQPLHLHDLRGSPSVAAVGPTHKDQQIPLGGFGGLRKSQKNKQRRRGAQRKLLHQQKPLLPRDGGIKHLRLLSQRFTHRTLQLRFWG